MTDQTNLPRTREAQARGLSFTCTAGITERASADMSAKEHIFEAEARGDEAGYERGRAEALAELRAGAEPTMWARLAKNGSWQGTHYPEAHRSEGTEVKPLYDHPPVAREAELAAEVERLRGALEHAERWSDRAHTACTGTGPKQALGEMLCALRDFLRAALAAAPEKRDV